MRSQGLNNATCITNALLVDRTHTAYYMEAPQNICWVNSWDKKMSQYNYISQLEKAEGYNWWTDEGKSLVSLAFAPQQGSSSQCSSEGKTQEKVYWGCSILKTWGCYWDWTRTTAATRRKWVEGGVWLQQSCPTALIKGKELLHVRSKVWLGCSCCRLCASYIVIGCMCACYI